MGEKRLTDKMTENLTSGLDIRCTDGPDGMVEATRKLLLDEGYRGPIVIVYGNEGLYRFTSPDEKGNVHMLFIDEDQLGKGGS